MSINWVMLDETQGFVRLPGEKPVWKSSPRTGLGLTRPRAHPADSPLSIQSSTGTVYLTNQRLVYLPEKPTVHFKSFAASLLNLHDTHITVPWFGPNAWQALVQPVPGGNITSSHHVELKLTFKDGGAPDFHSNFERIKERLQQAVDVARSDNMAGRRQDGSLSGVNMDSVHLDQLPSYADSGSDPVAPPSTERRENLMDDPLPAPIPQRASARPPWHDQPAQPVPPRGDGQPGRPEPPSDAPPGYEETQQQSVQVELERRLGQEEANAWRD